MPILPRGMALSTCFLMTALLSMPLAAAGTATHTATSILHSTNEIHISTGILAAIAIIAGAIVCIAGYRLFRAAIFFCGFVLGGLVVASIAEVVFKNQSYLETASWVGFALGGIFVGLFAISLYSTSVFVAGAVAGVLLAFTVQTTVAYRIYPSDPNIVLVVLAVVLGLLCGALAVWLERPVIIIATSFAGAVALVWGVGNYAGEFPNGADLKYYAHQTVDKQWVYSIPDAWWAYLAGIVVVFLLGMLLQFRKTARDYNYKFPSQSRALGRDEYGDVGTPPQTNDSNPISYV